MTKARVPEGSEASKERIPKTKQHKSKQTNKQKNMPKEIKPETINSKKTNQTSEASKDVGNILRGLI